MKRKLVQLVLALLLALAIPTVANAGYESNPVSPAQRQYVWSVEPKIHTPGTLDSEYFLEEFASGVSQSGLIPYVAIQTDQGLRICQKVTPDCLAASTRIPIDGLFTLCSDDAGIACIKSIEYQAGDGSWHSAQVTQKVDQTPTQAAVTKWLSGFSIPATSTLGEVGWPSFESLGVPGSAKGPLVISLPGVNNAAGTDTYALTANYWVEKTSTYPKAFTGRMRSFDMSVRPIVVDSSHGNSVVRMTYKDPNGPDNITGNGTFDVETGEVVAESSPSQIGWAAGFGDKVNLRVTLKLPKDIGGWFQSRLSQPDINITSNDADSNLVTIAGAPAHVPIAEGAIDAFSPTLKQDLANTFFSWDAWDKFPYKANARGIFSYGPWSPNQGLDGWDAWARRLGNTAMGSADVWSVGHIDAAAQCMNSQSELQGLVNTNALVFQPSVPTYSNNELTYKVAGQHYESNGQVFKGEYSFIMRDSVARCLYGFRDAPISGTVSVTSSDGAEQVAYTNVSDRDGWLKLTAQGFTFSNPTISAKLTQAPAVKPTPTPIPTQTAKPSASPTPTASPSSKLKAILCVKGKVVRQITGTNPKCPAGYKKKG